MLLALVVASGSAMAFEVTRSCAVNEVYVNNFGGTVDRVHVRCSTVHNDGFGDSFYYALPLNGNVKASATATQLINMANTARSTGRLLTISYTAGDFSGAAYGCLTIDCRKPKTFWIN